jgi:hypothetical protein
VSELHIQKFHIITCDTNCEPLLVGIYFGIFLLVFRLYTVPLFYNSVFPNRCSSYAENY